MPAAAVDEARSELADRLTVVASPLLALEVGDLVSAAWRVMLAHSLQPTAQMKLLIDLAEGLTRAWLSGGAAAEPTRKDVRFADPTWRENPLYARMRASYIALADAMTRMPDRVELAPDDRELARLGLALLSDAVAPTNLLWTNPVALRRAMDTSGASIARGAANLARDLVANGGRPAQVDPETFEIGRTIAATKGAVVYQDDVMELLQYEAATPQVAGEPLLFIPSPVNRYYVLDLAPSRSLFEYAIAQGFTVFAISLRNPGAAERDWGIATYARAIADAVGVIRTITQAKKVHGVATCAGGINLAAAMAAARRRGDACFQTCTFLVTTIDLTEAEGLFALVNERLAGNARARSKARGIVTKQTMFWMFAMLRPNDAIWNHWVNNYLLGNSPPAHDLLYWANDHTNLAARMHSDLLDLFVGDEAGGLQELGLADVGAQDADTDVYALAAHEDHLMPWRNCYRTAQRFGARCTFVLHARGHITSLLHPPQANGGGTFLGPSMAALPPDEWKEKANFSKRSWWPHWIEWLRTRSGEQRKATAELGCSSHPPLRPAPGLYVRQ